MPCGGDVPPAVFSAAEKYETRSSPEKWVVRKARKPTTRARASHLLARIFSGELDTLARVRKRTRNPRRRRLARRARIPELSELLGRWRKEREQHQADLERAGTSPNDNDTAKIAKRAIARMGKMRESLQAGEPAMVRAAVKELVAEVSLSWRQDGDRYRKLTKGVLTMQSPRGFALSSIGKTGPPATIS
jgi:hypothetical protein